MFKDNASISEILKIERAFDLEENYLFNQLNWLLISGIDEYELNHQRRKNYRPSETRKDLIKFTKQIIKGKINIKSKSVRTLIALSEGRLGELVVNYEESRQALKDYLSKEIDGCYLHLTSELPNDLEKYTDSYLFIDHNQTKKVYYVDFNLIKKEIKINNLRNFKKNLNDIKEQNNQSNKLHLSGEEFYKLITSNGGHAIIKDTGRLSGSLPQYLIYELIKIYLTGTKKDPKCSWNSIENKGQGELFEFLIAIRNLFIGVNYNNLYLGTHKTICEITIKLLNVHKDYLHNYQYDSEYEDILRDRLTTNETY